MSIPWSQAVNEADATFKTTEELVALYAKRWGHETYYREMKKQLRTTELLHAHTVETACQEIATLVIATAVLAEQRRKIAAEARDLQVTAISFRRTLELTRAYWLISIAGEGILSAAQEKLFAQRMFECLLDTKPAKQRFRSYPRSVRQPIKGWPRKLRNSHSTSKPTITILQAR